MSSQIYAVVFLKCALKQLQQLEKSAQKAIVNKLKKLSENGVVSDIKKMQGHENLFRIRSGDYRIIYYLDKKQKQCTITDIAHRKDIYRMMHTNLLQS